MRGMPLLTAEMRKEIISDVMSWANYGRYANSTTPKSVKILEIKRGYGRHTCSADCRSECYKSCDDSDLIVEVEYGTNGWQATYGILDGRIILWAN